MESDQKAAVLKLTIRGNPQTNANGIQAWQMLGVAPAGTKNVTVRFKVPTVDSLNENLGISEEGFHFRCKPLGDLPPNAQAEINENWPDSHGVYWLGTLLVHEHPQLLLLNKWYYRRTQAGQSGASNQIAPADGVCIAVSLHNAPTDMADYVPYLWGENHFCDLYDADVLLIHGIGQHKQGDTLVGFAEPILEFYENWFSGKTQHWMNNIGKQEFIDWARYTLKAGLKGRHDRGGLYSQIEKCSKRLGVYDEVFLSLDELSENEPPTQPPLSLESDNEIVMGCIRVYDTTLHPPALANVNAAFSTFRISTIDQYGVLDEAHILVCEGWWANNAALPDFKQLSTWGFSILPTVVSVYYKHMYRFYKREKNDNIFAGLVVDILFSVFAKSLAVFVCLIAWFFLGFASLLSLIPIPFIRSMVTPIINVLLGTTGQSYALTYSPLRRSAITHAASGVLDSLQNTSKNILLMSHSQGSEITRHIIEKRDIFGIRSWISFGSGINLLNMISNQEMPSRPKKVVLTAAGFTFGMLILQFGMAYGWADFLEYLSKTTLFYAEWSGVQWSICCAIFVGISFFFKGTKKEEFNPGRLLRPENAVDNRELEWTDYYASHDPVPCGRIKIGGRNKESKDKREEGGESLRGLRFFSRPVMNKRSTIADHTSYLENVPQFVVPVAFKIAAMAGLNIQQLHADDPDRIKRAVKRQEKRTKLQGLLRFWLIIFFISASVSSFEHFRLLFSKPTNVLSTANSDSSTSLLFWVDQIYTGNVFLILATVFAILYKILFWYLESIHLKALYKRPIEKESKEMQKDTKSDQ